MSDAGSLLDWAAKFMPAEQRWSMHGWTTPLDNRRRDDLVSFGPMGHEQLHHFEQGLCGNLKSKRASSRPNEPSRPDIALSPSRIAERGAPSLQDSAPGRRSEDRWRPRNSRPPECRGRRKVRRMIHSLHGSCWRFQRFACSQCRTSKSKSAPHSATSGRILSACVWPVLWL